VLGLYAGSYAADLWLQLVACQEAFIVGQTPLDGQLPYGSSTTIFATAPEESRTSCARDFEHDGTWEVLQPRGKAAMKYK